MQVERISGIHDPRIAEYRAVPEPELVRARGLLVVEGRLVVRRVLESEPRFRVRSLLLSPAALQSLEPVLVATGATCPIYLCETRDFASITGFDIHRGCLGLVERPPRVDVDDLLASARRVVVLEGVTNADNVGGVFRDAAAFGVDAVLLSPTSCDPFYRKAIRTSMAATLRVPFATFTEWPGGLSGVRAAGFTLVALTPRAPAERLDLWAREHRPERVALLVGTEGDGLTPEVASAADVRVRIPMAPGVDSLNLAVAAGVALYALRVPSL